MNANPTDPPLGCFSINLIEDDRGRLLLLRRSLDKQWGPGLWGFPAGHIEPGETPEQCSVRENCEELGGDLRVEFIKRHAPVRDTLYGGRYEIHLFHYRYVNGDIALNHEHTAYAWVERERFRDYDLMDGVDEDIHYLGIWPREFLREEKLPRKSECGM